MSRKFVVLVVFAVVAQASTSSVADVQADRKITHDSWYQAVHSLYNTISNSSVALADGQAQYVAPAVVGRKAFLDAAPQGKNQTLLDQLSVLGKTELGLMFGAIATARSATAANLSAAITLIDNSRKQMPLAEGVELDFQFAGSSASSPKLSDASAAINRAFDGYYKGIKKSAEYAVGKTTKVDTSSEAQAQKELWKYIEIIYGLVSGCHA